jgi:hypothetical protein
MAVTSEPIFFKASRKPSTDALQKAFSNLTWAECNAITQLLSGSVDLMTYPAAENRQSQAYHSHDHYILAMEAVNGLLGAYGVEYVAHKDDGYAKGSFRGFYYFNFGDTYDTTILVSAQGENWTIGCWGDRVERNPGKYV